MNFPTTRWTHVAAATLHGDSDGRAALDILCEQYYSPVRRFIAWRRGLCREVDDLTQAFFLYFLQQGLTHRADRLRGKFRTFLLATLRRFLSHHDRAANAEKRGGSNFEIEIDDEVLAANEGEVNVFDREWALTLMQNALARVGAEIEAARGSVGLDTLRHFLGGSQEPPTYEAAAAQLGLSLTATKQEILRWRRRLGEIVRLEVGRTVSAPHETREEIAYLRHILLS